MVSRIRPYISYAAVAIVACAVCKTSAADSAARGDFTFSGVVCTSSTMSLDSTQEAALSLSPCPEPVEGAKVEVSGEGDDYVAAVTDARGRFRLAPVHLTGGPGDVISVTKMGYAGFRMAGFNESSWLRPGVEVLTVGLPVAVCVAKPAGGSPTATRRSIAFPAAGLVVGLAVGILALIGRYRKKSRPIG